jgi:hypothetical protein
VSAQCAYYACRAAEESDCRKTEFHASVFSSDSNIISGTFNSPSLDHLIEDARMWANRGENKEGDLVAKATDENQTRESTK